MGFNYEQAEEYVQEARKIENILSEHQELFNEEKLFEYRDRTKQLSNAIITAKSDSRKLSVGIVGAVKAGKSSFLNALLFDGKDYLPKAATPMTAALTKITYSDQPKAVIHFYDREGWQDIEIKSKAYDEKLENDYNDYVENWKRKKEKNPSGKNPEQSKIKTKEEFEKSHQNQIPEVYRSSKELTDMAKNADIMDKLGETVVEEGDIFKKLDNYVGANGKYTSIVSHVELQVNNPELKDWEIVDTPGLNDPIVSRVKATKTFLRECDVVILLSPCSQFMDVETVNLMANRLPEAGVKEILLVGSKLDSGILNESEDDDFRYAWKKSLDSYATQFLLNIEKAKESERHLDILNKMTANKIHYISSICFSIKQKLLNQEQLEENEQLVYDNLHHFQGFKDEYFVRLANIDNVHKALEDVRRRKEDIIEGRDRELLNNAKYEHAQILEKIYDETSSSRLMLEQDSAEELEQKTNTIKKCIDSSRKQLTYAFKEAEIKCEEKVQQILPQLSIEAGQHQKISKTSRTEENTYTVKTGFLKLKKEIVHETETISTADTSSVINNIKQFSAKSKIFINTEFKYIFNREEFSRKIKEIVLQAFQDSEKEFDEKDILLPLQNVLAKISIPDIHIDFSNYLDEVDARFPEGFAENNDIHKLNALQSRLLNQMEEELINKLLAARQEIQSTLQKQAISFADQIENEFCAELEKLKTQIIEKEHYIKSYTEFAETVKQLKQKVLA